MLLKGWNIEKRTNWKFTGWVTQRTYLLWFFFCLFILLKGLYLVYFYHPNASWSPQILHWSRIYLHTTTERHDWIISIIKAISVNYSIYVIYVATKLFANTTKYKKYRNRLISQNLPCKMSGWCPPWQINSQKKKTMYVFNVIYYQAREFYSLGSGMCIFKRVQGFKCLNIQRICFCVHIHVKSSNQISCFRTLINSPRIYSISIT